MNENNPKNNPISVVQQKEEEVFSFLSKRLEGMYTVVHPQSVCDAGYDIAIFRDTNLLVVIQLKFHLEDSKLNYNGDRSGIRLRAMTIGASLGPRIAFFVLTDGEIYWVFDYRSGGLRSYLPEEFVRFIRDDYRVDASKPSTQWVVKQIAELASSYQLASLSKYVNKHVNSFEFDRISGSFSLKIPIEDRFFKRLLPQDRGLSDMCRFTTLDSAFKMLKDSRQNMCNILCMNDRSEGIYADRKVFDEIPGFRRDAFDESDHCYILSLMDAVKADDLTMWRLYGDGAKGVCLSYAQRTLDKQKKISDPFFLGRVSYGRIIDGNEVHKELDFLRDLVNKDFGDGWRFKLRRWGIWKHFFKSYHFSDEKEIRLLFYDRNDDREPYEWIKNSESQIITKMQLFPVGVFPLEVKRILVGPRNPELDIVCRQMQLLSDHSKKEILVKASNVTVYR